MPNKLTIITPTYNRAYILPVLYESLKQQTLLKFEWIIVDDGSTDNTESLAKSWINSESLMFEIKYFKQKNGGKHRALNLGVSNSRYEYIYIIDSDDYMTEDGVQHIYDWISSISDEKNFAGVSGLRGKSKREKLGGFPKNKKTIDATNLERKKKHLSGDKAEVYKRSILIKYPFPQFDGENFLSEGAVWNKIASDGYKIRWFNEVICICEYLEDGLTNNHGEEVLLNNFQGYTYITKLNIENKKSIQKYWQISTYIERSHKKGINKKEVISKLNISNTQLILSLPFYYFRKFIFHSLKRRILWIQSKKIN